MNIFKKIINLKGPVCSPRFGGAGRQAGQTLLEVMLALSIAILIVSAIVVSIINSLNNEQFGVSQNQATQLAQEGVDLFRNLSQSDWATFTSYGRLDTTDAISWCLPEVNPTPYSRPGLPAGCGLNPGNRFVREITIELNMCITPTPGANISGRVTSTVKWADGKCTGTGDAQYCHKTEVVSCMFRPYINSNL